MQWTLTFLIEPRLIESSARRYANNFEWHYKSCYTKTNSSEGSVCKSIICEGWVCKSKILGSVHIWRQQDFGKFYPPPLIISLGEYINAIVSRIVIGTLDLKQFLPKFKYFCWRQQGLDPLPPLSATVSILKPPPPSAADVICERSLIVKLNGEKPSHKLKTLTYT